MPALTAFDSTVAARTRAAANILETPDLLAGYARLGGLKDDLVEIRDAGQRAEALNGAQSGAQAAGGAATAKVLEGFAALQADYKAVMAAVVAARRDLMKGGAVHEVLAAMDKIIVNETEVAVRSVTTGVDADGKPVKKRAATHRVSQEALRAEIAKDAGALIGLKAAHAVLAKRGVDAKRLARLKSDADDLAGKLAERRAAKGGAKTATTAEREAVAEQREVWGSSYRILAALGRQDHRVAGLLGEAARKKK